MKNTLEGSNPCSTLQLCRIRETDRNSLFSRVPRQEHAVFSKVKGPKGATPSNKNKKKRSALVVCLREY